MAEENTPKPAAQAQQGPAQPQAAQPQQSKTKRNKINLMSLGDIERKLAEVKEKMGNLKSRYAKQLLKQKEFLTKTHA
jgi:hypothetical protein